jgi:hypothetical protein
MSVGADTSLSGPPSASAEGSSTPECLHRPHSDQLDVRRQFSRHAAEFLSDQLHHLLPLE